MVKRLFDLLFTIPCKIKGESEKAIICIKLNYVR